MQSLLSGPRAKNEVHVEIRLSRNDQNVQHNTLYPSLVQNRVSVYLQELVVGGAGPITGLLNVSAILPSTIAVRIHGTIEGTKHHSHSHSFSVDIPTYNRKLSHVLLARTRTFEDQCGRVPNPVATFAQYQL